MDALVAKRKNNSDVERSSGFRPVDSAEKRDFAGSDGMSREGVSRGKIN